MIGRIKCCLVITLAILGCSEDICGFFFFVVFFFGIGRKMTVGVVDSVICDFSFHYRSAII